MAKVQTIDQTVVIDGVGFSANATGTPFENMVDLDVELAPAKIGELTTRTDAETGTLTMDSGHGITTGARLDLYWLDDEDTSAVAGSRRGITVGTVSGVTVPIGADNAGEGDDLPPVNTPITAMVPHEKDDVTFTEDDMVCLGFTAIGIAEDRMCQISLGEEDTGYTEGGAIVLNGATWDATALWSDTYFGASPVAAATTVNTIYVSHGDPVNTVTARLRIGIP